MSNPYIVVGGVGGSGTRMIITILKELGLHIGNDLNEANDNLTFTLLFKHINTLSMTNEEIHQHVKIIKKEINHSPLSSNEIDIVNQLSTKGRPGHDYQWIQERANHLKQLNQSIPIPRYHTKVKPLMDKWGWKEPNSHIIMKSLHELYPSMKFIMVVRNGLDMAYSTNQNQLRLWGPVFLPKEYIKYDKYHHIVYTPKVSLKYWRLIHEKIIAESKIMKSNFLMINYDDMCLHPEKWLTILFDFLELNHDLIPLVSSFVHPLKQSKYSNLNEFDKSDIEFNRQLGFDVIS
jgi:Sulfotransferase family